MYLTKYDDYDAIGCTDDSGQASDCLTPFSDYYGGAQSAGILTRSSRELAKEKARADALEAELFKANNEILRVQKWRLATAILFFIACIIALVFAHNLMSIDDEYNFYHKHAAVVTENGSYYHRYDCEKIASADGFYILNTRYAESLGYEPCKYCWGE